MAQECTGTSQEHADAIAIVEFLMGNNGTVEANQDEIARKLDMLKYEKRGLYTTDVGRYNRARNHLHERVDVDGRPCCGYRIHYRRSGPISTLSLVDPSGDLGAHAKAAIGTVRGWSSREKQHHTESQRMIKTVEALADHSLANGDKHGYRLLQHVCIQLETNGTVPPGLMAELDVWLAGMQTSA